MGCKIIDLSLEMSNDIKTMPMDPKFNITQHCTLDDLGYNLSRITMSTHQSTHLDVPRHFFYEGAPIEKVPIERFIGNAIKIDLKNKSAKDPIYPDDLAEHDAQIIKGANILLETGWDKILPQSAYFSNFPYITSELADWLADRKINLVGMDIPTPNQSQWQYIHKRLLGAGIIIVEGLAKPKRNYGKEIYPSCITIKNCWCRWVTDRAIAIEGNISIN